MILLDDILKKINHLSFSGSRDVEIEDIVQLNDINLTPNSISWCSDKNKPKLLDVNQGTIILSEYSYSLIKSNAKENVNWIVVDNPRKAFANILKSFFTKPSHEFKIEKSAIIHPSVKLNAASYYIGHNVIIEEGVTLGKSVIIEHNTVIMANTIIESNVKIGSNCTIGAVGFGYELNKNGEYDLIPHIGKVHIKESAEIGNNVCIDRAVLGSTVIGENVKIDNLVHIAHGVKIGKNSLIIASAMIAGSVDIGENVWIAPSSSIIQKVEIGDNSLIGIGSVVLKDVEPSIIVAGIPAKKISDK